MTTRDRTRPDTGFTLVELLVAFAILLLGMTGIISLFAAGLALETSGSLEADAASALAELEPVVRERLRALVEEGGADGNLRLPLQDVPDRPGLAYEVEAMAVPDLTNLLLVRTRILPRGARIEDAVDTGWLPLRIGPTFEELVRKSPEVLPPAEAGR